LGLWHNENQRSTYLGRVADVDYQLGMQLQHSFDLKKLSEKIDKLFAWHTDENVREQYLAPYFPVVQSSGMGKTKLLFEYKKGRCRRALRYIVLQRRQKRSSLPVRRFLLELLRKRIHNTSTPSFFRSTGQDPRRSEKHSEKACLASRRSASPYHGRRFSFSVLSRLAMSQQSQHSSWSSVCRNFLAIGQLLPRDRVVDSF